jgi:hypothetical protein
MLIRYQVKHNFLILTNLLNLIYLFRFQMNLELTTRALPKYKIFKELSWIPIL